MTERIAIVTGASRGIGAEVARTLVKKGIKVIGTRAKNKDVPDIPCSDWIIADFSDDKQLSRCAAEIKKLKPNILINNAGVNKIGHFEKINPDDFLFIQKINVFAPFLFCQSVLPSMSQRSWGRIVNISSIWGKVGKELRASYAASKFALDGITLAIAAEYAQKGILANCVAPGFIDTSLTREVLGPAGMRSVSALVPARRLGSPQEISKFVVWLASDENTYISGQNIAIDGGFSRV